MLADLQKHVAALYARSKYDNQPQPKQWPNWPSNVLPAYPYVDPYYYVDKTNGTQLCYGYTAKTAGLKQPKNK